MRVDTSSPMSRVSRRPTAKTTNAATTSSASSSNSSTSRILQHTANSLAKLTSAGTSRGKRVRSPPSAMAAAARSSPQSQFTSGTGNENTPSSPALPPSPSLLAHTVSSRNKSKPVVPARVGLVGSSDSKAVRNKSRKMAQDNNFLHQPSAAAHSTPGGGSDTSMAMDITPSTQNASGITDRESTTGGGTGGTSSGRPRMFRRRSSSAQGDMFPSPNFHLIST